MCCLAPISGLSATLGFWLLVMALACEPKFRLSSWYSRKLAVVGLVLMAPFIAVVVSASAEWGFVSESRQAIIVKGMHADEVTRLLGEPREQRKYDDGSALWYYCGDWIALSTFGVFLNADRRVESTAIID